MTHLIADETAKPLNPPLFKFARNAIGMSSYTPYGINGYRRPATRRERMEAELEYMAKCPLNELSNGQIDKLKKKRRMERNREAARRSRERKAVQLQILREEKNQLIQENDALRNMLESASGDATTSYWKQMALGLQDQMKKVQTENFELRQLAFSGSPEGVYSNVSSGSDECKLSVSPLTQTTRSESHWDLPPSVLDPFISISTISLPMTTPIPTGKIIQESKIGKLPGDIRLSPSVDLSLTNMSLINMPRLDLGEAVNFRESGVNIKSAGHTTCGNFISGDSLPTNRFLDGSENSRMGGQLKGNSESNPSENA